MIINHRPSHTPQCQVNICSLYFDLDTGPCVVYSMIMTWLQDKAVYILLGYEHSTHLAINYITYHCCKGRPIYQQ